MFGFLHALVFGGIVSITACAFQAPINPETAFKSYDDGFFKPIETLSALSENAFTTMGHPNFPNYSVRIKKSKICDKTVKSYTGYIDINAHHLFFYFFESRSDPDKDDVILWTNGGPGCSSTVGLFMELGPCRILDENGPKFHPESWNSNANIFFIDQPAGVGYSYADYGDPVSNSQDAAKDITAFVTIFFENFSKFKGRAFHLAGESYGGRYLPIFASDIYDHNSKLIESGLTPINLTSIMLGNGLTSFYLMFEGYYKTTCTGLGDPNLYDISTCVAMKKSLPRCLKWYKESCVDQFDHINCAAASSFCSALLVEPYFAAGMNPYDITKACSPEDFESSLCYPVLEHATNYLNRDDVRHKLGVDDAQNFTRCSTHVATAFAASLDMTQPTQLHVAALLERGVKVLVYVGANDWICNWHGNEAWTLDLEWSGQDDFKKQPLRKWQVDGQDAGKTRSAGGFTFATIYGGGHMVPYDKPKESLELVNRWLRGQKL